jgi:hypothetical protein
VVKSTKKNTHLKPAWKPGESGNPAGRPKKQHTLSDLLAQFGEHKYDRDKTYREQLIEIIWEQAMNGDSDFIKLIFDRVEGKALERVLNANVQKEEMKFDFGNL